MTGWSLRQRVLLLFTLVGVLMTGFAGYAASVAAESNEQLDVLLERTGPMRVAGQELYSAYLDQETGVRGFALGGTEKNLEPYEKGRAAEDRLLTQIETLNGPGGRAGIRDGIARIRAEAQAWQGQVAEPVIAAGRSSGTAGAQAVIDDAGTDRFDALRVAIDGLQENITALRNDAATAARSTGSTLVLLEIVTAVLAVLVIALLLFLLDRLVSRPVTDLAEQVRRVADGDYGRRIESSGSPELRALAADVDAMRQRIADELAEVRSAREQIEIINGRLQAQADELTRSNGDLEQFAYVASHDLQEPLRKVASFCQLLQRRYAGQLDERADQYIAFAVDGAQRMQRLINDLLAFSRIGRITSGFRTIDLDQVVTEAAAQLDPSDGKIESGGLPTVEGEEPLLVTLFVNLIGNSIKFRRPEVPPLVRITARREGDEWQINVRDNGIGIETEYADKVFVIFQRLHSSDAYEGTGIGLAVVKKIVEYHGGRIWLDLEVTEGSSIWFTIPAPPEESPDGGGAAPDDEGGA
ncbi:sensor histidine kinase [Paractinoplanes rishiriensis]|uniref:histidine kinase n=1 Tax=Paractinoplanes rishiriensis TaxID=1050105 RepID=A0A919N1R0_9ACTN|nr:ATP-binding protein [Actinoplanes rishiriensis]GIF02111.1 histidine kinase [Actinoplanes rishiriensis]